jgi:hypothetical protein
VAWRKLAALRCQLTGLLAPELQTLLKLDDSAFAAGVALVWKIVEWGCFPPLSALSDVLLSLGKSRTVFTGRV